MKHRADESRKLPVVTTTEFYDLVDQIYESIDHYDHPDLTTSGVYAVLSAYFRIVDHGSVGT